MRALRALVGSWVPATGGMVVGVVLAGSLATSQTAPAPDGAEATRARGLAAAAAWSDALDAHRAPRLPAPGDTENLVVVLAGRPAAWEPPGARAAAAARLRDRQLDLESGLSALGGTVTHRWQVVLNGVAVRVPTGRADAVASLPGVVSVTPVTYLAPAARGTGAPAPASGRDLRVLPERDGPAHVALIDTAVDPRAPQLGGGVGPTFPVIGGLDLVDGDADPTVTDTAPAWEAHGTQMAGLVVGSPALDGLPPERVPRLLAYRVVAEETVDGRPVPLARSDRVITALERSADPDGDGDPADGAEVVLLGLAGSFAGGGADPLATATRGATRAGALVVAPAGNEGPTYARMGSLGEPASEEGVLTVGGATEDRAPRSAALRVGVGPAEAVLEGLPLLGPPPGDDAARLVVLPGPAGPGTGATDAEYATAAQLGVDPAGAVVIVSRGGGTLQQKAAAAAAAGAAGLVVWDRAGTGVFPSGASGGGPALPVVGVGPAQGEALAALLEETPGVSARIVAEPRPEAPVAVASFSSTGPTADGRVKPDLVAPAVEVTAPWPPAPDGSPRTAPMTGTSAAAAQAAAVALRLRVDRPDLTPSAARALLVAGARPLAGERLVAQGAGLLAGPARGPVVAEPAIVSSGAGVSESRARLDLVDTTGEGGRYLVTVTSAAGQPLGAARPVRVQPGGAGTAAVDLPDTPRGWSGAIGVTDPSGTVVLRVPAATFPRRRPGRDELGRPDVATRGGVTQAVVRIGRLARVGDRLRSAPLHRVRVLLEPADGSAPLVVAGVGGAYDWPAGTYRFVLSRRLPSGGSVPPGRYRLMVSALGADGLRLVTRSRAFRLR